MTMIPVAAAAGERVYHFKHGWVPLEGVSLHADTSGKYGADRRKVVHVEGKPAGSVEKVVHETQAHHTRGGGVSRSTGYRAVTGMSPDGTPQMGASREHPEFKTRKEAVAHVAAEHRIAQGGSPNVAGVQPARTEPGATPPGGPRTVPATPADMVEPGADPKMLAEARGRTKTMSDNELHSAHDQVSQSIDRAVERQGNGEQVDMSGLHAQRQALNEELARRGLIDKPAPSAPSAPATDSRVTGVPSNPSQPGIRAEQLRKGDQILHPQTGRPVTVTSVSSHGERVNRNTAVAYQDENGRRQMFDSNPDRVHALATPAAPSEPAATPTAPSEPSVPIPGEKAHPESAQALRDAGLKPGDVVRENRPSVVNGQVEGHALQQPHEIAGVSRNGNAVLYHPESGTTYHAPISSLVRHEPTAPSEPTPADRPATIMNRPERPVDVRAGMQQHSDAALRTMAKDSNLRAQDRQAAQHELDRRGAAGAPTAPTAPAADRAQSDRMRALIDSVKTARNPDQSTVHLQGVGKHPAKPVSEFKPGDKVVYNYGMTGDVKKNEDLGNGKHRITTAENGKEFTNTRKSTTLLGHRPGSESPTDTYRRNAETVPGEGGPIHTEPAIQSPSGRSAKMQRAFQAASEGDHAWLQGHGFDVQPGDKILASDQSNRIAVDRPGSDHYLTHTVNGNGQTAGLTRTPKNLGPGEGGLPETFRTVHDPATGGVPSGLGGQAEVQQLRDRVAKANGGRSAKMQRAFTAAEQGDTAWLAAHGFNAHQGDTLHVHDAANHIAISKPGARGATVHKVNGNGQAVTPDTNLNRDVQQVGPGTAGFRQVGTPAGNGPLASDRNAPAARSGQGGASSVGSPAYLEDKYGTPGPGGRPTGVLSGPEPFPSDLPSGQPVVFRDAQGTVRMGRVSNARSDGAQIRDTEGTNHNVAFNDVRRITMGDYQKDSGLSPDEIAGSTPNAPAAPGASNAGAEANKVGGVATPYEPATPRTVNGQDLQAGDVFKVTSKRYLNTGGAAPIDNPDQLYRVVEGGGYGNNGDPTYVQIDANGNDVGRPVKMMGLYTTAQVVGKQRAPKA